MQPITFYYGSGSPFAWRVWFALEHKQLPYDLRVMSFSNKDHLQPEFIKLNPHHQIPVIVDNGFSLYESTAILEYLDEAYPDSDMGLLYPGDPKQRALIRRLILEADANIHAKQSKTLIQLSFGKLSSEGL